MIVRRRFETGMGTDILSVVFLGLAGAVAIMDYYRRAVWRAVPIVGALIGFWCWPEWSWLGLLAGGAIPVVAGLPLGDVWVGAMLGGWLGLTGTIGVWFVALVAGLVVWIGYHEGWWAWPGDWPFTPFVLLPACAIVLAQRVG